MSSATDAARRNAARGRPSWGNLRGNLWAFVEPVGMSKLPLLDVFLGEDVYLLVAVPLELGGV
jgi:hypothetical protein